MAGHSKWNNIKNRKASVDAKKAKDFAIVGKLITIAIKEGGSGDPAQNPRLRLALDKAKAANMPNVNVQKAIDKGLGKGSGDIIEEIVYEGYGPGGVGYIVRALTDNRNRTASEIKYLFDRNGGSLGGPGSVMFMFERSNDTYNVTVPIPVDEETKSKNEGLIELLEDNEDVELVITNMA